MLAGAIENLAKRLALCGVGDILIIVHRPHDIFDPADALKVLGLLIVVPFWAAGSSLRDPDAAAELGREVALGFLRRGFHRLDPSYRRFLDFSRRPPRNQLIDELQGAWPQPRRLARIAEMCRISSVKSVEIR